MSRNGVLGQGGRPGGKEGLLQCKMSTHSSRDSRRWLWRTVARFLSITETLRSQTRLAGVGEASEDPTQLLGRVMGPSREEGGGGIHRLEGPPASPFL